MAVEFNFYLSDRDFDKLRCLKKADRSDGMTCNDYAEMILSNRIDSKYREYDKKGLISHDEDE